VQGLNGSSPKLQLRGEADALIAAKLDRISRSVQDLAALLGRFKQRGWSLIALDLDVDTSRPSGRFVLQMIGCASEYERLIIGERVAAAHSVRRALGIRGGQAPLLPSDLRHRIVRLHGDGLSLHAVARLLNDEGVATARGASWYASTVAHVLRSVALDTELVRLAHEHALLASPCHERAYIDLTWARSPRSRQSSQGTWPWSVTESDTRTDRAAASTWRTLDESLRFLVARRRGREMIVSLIRRRALALISMLVIVTACGDNTSRPRAQRCESEAWSFSVPTGWGVNKQPPGDTFPSCRNLHWGASGLFEQNGLGPEQGNIWLVTTTSFTEHVRKIVASSGTDARVLDVTASDGVVSDKPITTVTFRIVRPIAGTERPAGLIALRTSYALPNSHPNAGQRREDLIIGYPGRTALATFFPSTQLPQPSNAEIKKALDTVAATFIPSPGFGK
jgi:hypothetical protein